MKKCDSCGAADSTVDGLCSACYESAFDEWWEARRRATWERTILPSERGKPVPVNWSIGFRAHCFEAWMASVRWCRLCRKEHEGACVPTADTPRMNAVMSLLRQAHAWISEDTEALQASHMPYNDTDPVDIEVRAEVDARRAWLAACQSTSGSDGT